MFVIAATADAGRIVYESGTSWLVLILAGAAGSALTMLARVMLVPVEIARNDRAIDDIDTDLDRYAADEYVRLAFELREIRFPGGAPSSNSDVEISRNCALAVVRATQLYRDEENARLRDVREMLVAELVTHRIWRAIWHRPVPDLKTPARASQLLDKWQRLVPTYGGEDQVIRLIDPRERTIARVAPELEAKANEPN